MATDFTKLTKITNPEALGSFTEEQIVRDPSSPNIFLKQGVQPTGNLNFFDVPKVQQDLATAGTPEQIQDAVLPQELFADFNLGDANNIDSSVFNGFTTNGDLQKLLKEQSTARERLTAAALPSAEETSLKQQLNVLREGAQKGIDLTAQQVIPLEFITGEQQAIEQRFQRKESNLLNRLGLAQEARQAEIGAAETGLSFLAQDLDLQFKVKQAIDQKEQQVFQNALTLRGDAQNRLGTILDTFQGLTFDELDVATKTQLGTLAAQSGIPLQVLQQGMEVVADRLDFEQSIQAQQAQKFDALDVAKFSANLADTFGLDLGTATIASNQLLGIVNTPAIGSSITDPITGVATDNSKLLNVGGQTYNFTSYATDPNWGNAVSSILGKMPEFVDAASIDSYVQGIANSPIKGSEFMQVAEQSGINPKLLVAIAQHESVFGTQGVGARTFNPGNVGNTDSGASINQGNWVTGLTAMANNVNRRAVQVSPEDKQANLLASIKANPDSVENDRELNATELKSFGVGAGTTWGDVKSQQLVPGSISNAETVNTLTGINEGLDTLLKVLDKVPDRFKGQIQGRLASATRAAERKPVIAEFEANRAIIGMMLTRLFEKGRISDADREFYMSQMPNLNQNKEAAIASAKSLKEQIQRRAINNPFDAVSDVGGTFGNDITQDELNFLNFE